VRGDRGSFMERDFPMISTADAIPIICLAIAVVRVSFLLSPPD
jgi:hypothetical protein